MSTTIAGDGPHTFQWRCPSGHVTYERRQSLADPGSEVRCAECGERALDPELMPSDMDAWDGIAMHDCICSECEHTDRYAFNIKAGARITDPVVCEACGTLAAYSVVSGAAWNRSEDDFNYPHYDPGLDLVIESPEHHRQVMAERGLVRAEWGGMSMDDRTRLRRDREKSVDDEYAEYIDRVENAGDFAEFRRLRDSGYDGIDTITEIAPE